MGGLDRPEHQGADTERRADRAGHVELSGPARCLDEDGSGADDHGDGDGHVDEERCPPGDQVCEGATTSKPRLAPIPAVAAYQATAFARASPSK